jgi:hypothetical protein
MVDSRVMFDGLLCSSHSFEGPHDVKSSGKLSVTLYRIKNPSAHEKRRRL